MNALQALAQIEAEPFSARDFAKAARLDTDTALDLLQDLIFAGYVEEIAPYFYREKRTRAT